MERYYEAFPIPTLVQSALMSRAKNHAYELIISATVEDYSTRYGARLRKIAVQRESERSQ